MARGLFSDKSIFVLIRATNLCQALAVRLTEFECDVLDSTLTHARDLSSLEPMSISRDGMLTRRLWSSME